MRRLLFLLVLFVATVVGWRAYVALSDPVSGSLRWLGHERPTPFQPTVSYSEAKPVPSVLEVPPGEMLAAIRSGYMALPDRRFLLAIANVHHLLTGEPAGDVSCVFGDGRWTIRYGGAEVGQLSDLASFVEASSLLRRWVTSVSTAHGFSMAADASSERARRLTEAADLLDQIDIRSVAEAMRLVDAAWREGARNAAALQLAARGLTAITLQGYDRLHVGDAIPARALAVLVMAQALTSADVRREEALLAHAMGYTADARVAAVTVPAADPVRLFVDHEDDTLKRLASGEQATPFIRLLYGLRLVDTRNPEIAKPWLNSERNRPDDFGLVRFHPLVAMGRMDTDAEFAALIPYVALYDLWRVGLPDRALEVPLHAQLSRLDIEDLGSIGRLLRARGGVSEGAVARRFEKDLVLLDARFAGPFLDGWTFRSHFAGHFYSALWQLATLVLDDIASPPQAQELVRALESAPEGTAAEMRRWYAHLADASMGTPNTSALEEDLDALHLGAPALYRTYQELRTHSRSGVQSLDKPARRLASRVDARVENRAILAHIADYTRDLRRSGDYWYSNAQAAPELESRRLWLMSLEGDRRGLRRYVADTLRSLRYRVAAFELLSDSSGFGDDQFLMTQGRALVDASPSYWSARTAYIDYLESRRQYRAAARVAEEWLRLGRGSTEQKQVWARTAVARSLHELGDDEEAWRWIAPLAGGEDPGAVGIAALILQGKGEGEDALRTAQGLVQRYPTLPECRAVLAEILWKQHRDRDVVEVLYQQGYPLETWDWRLVVAPAFVGAFRERPVSEAATAVRVLLDAGVPDWQLAALSLGVQRLGRPDVAFAFLAAMPTTRSWGTLRRPLWAYERLRDLSGEAEALAWLRPRVPVNLLDAFAQLAHGEGADELLWTLVVHPEDTDFPDYVWLLRAGAQVLGSPGVAAHESELVSHYAALVGRSADVTEFYVALGAHLVGLLSEEQVLALATAPDQRCEVAYFLGLKAEGEGRFADAADWYQVVHHTEQGGEGEFLWATGRLIALSHRAIRSPSYDVARAP